MSAELAWPAAKVRQTFVDYFCKKNAHTVVPSAPVVPLRDPTLLFINAGMNQFKDIFTGAVDPNSDFGKMKRAANSQCCIRAGGKHNDLDDVGKDTYHHTFFEMLGNWSFADYFKKEAVAFCWELLVDIYGLPKEQLYATYFGGDEKLGLAPDHETRDMWLALLPADHVMPGSMKDNFWEMGDVGPCGPCTEVHFDRIGGRNAADLVNQDDPMVLEVWNLVFMQFLRTEAGGALQKLPSPHVDCGMGLERLVSVLQGKLSNYDTDLWSGLFEEIQKITKCPKSYAEAADDTDVLVAYRVVADHIRCITIALSDGAVPDSVGRGFVLRRIIRRAIRYGIQFLGAQTGFFEQLVPAVVSSLGGHFTKLPEEANVKRVRAIIKDEEESFAKTWKVGLKHFDTARQAAIAAKTTEISPQDAFTLHDRYGFPVDLTALLAEKEGMTVDVAKFQEVMKKNQTSGGRMAAAKTFLGTTQLDDLQRQGVPATDDQPKYVWEPIAAKVVALVNKDEDAIVDTIDSTAKQVGLIADRSCFYYESGGQIYDTGVVRVGDAVLEVEKVFCFGGYVVHIGKLQSGEIKVGAEARLEVNYDRRLPVAANHTSTHQLNHALRSVLQFGSKDSFAEVNQRGSWVGDELLRFDFSWNAKLSPAELAAVEEKMNAAIQADLKIYSQLVPLADAMEIKSLRCMFDEKYPDPVSLVTIGQNIDDIVADPKNEQWQNYSVELCGGTHLKTLGEAQQAVIISEEALMKGIRRMVMYTRGAATAAIAKGNAFAEELAALVAKDMDEDDKQKALSVLNKNVGDSDIPVLQKLKIRGQVDDATKVVVAAKKKKAVELKALGAVIGAELAAAHSAGAKTLVVKTDKLKAEREPLQAAIDAFMKVHPEAGIFVIGVDAVKEKALAMVAVPKEMAAGGLTAVDWAKSVGKGGGKPTAAQIGVAFDKVDEAMQAATAFAQSKSA